MTALTVKTQCAKTIQAGAGTAGKCLARTAIVSAGNPTRHTIQLEAAVKEEGARHAANERKEK